MEFQPTMTRLKDDDEDDDNADDVDDEDRV